MRWTPGEASVSEPLPRGPGRPGVRPSRITCAFVPENPKELTPARTGPGNADGSDGHGVASEVTSTGNRPQSSFGFGVSKCRCGGISPSRIASSTLITPASPAADSRWPMLVFTEPSSSGRSGSRPSPYTAAAACTSMGSPSSVPVPCASRYATSEAAIPARPSASRITRSCAGPFGTVSPALAPSWFTAEPSTVARIRSPSRSASTNRFNTSTPHPSPRT